MTHPISARLCTKVSFYVQDVWECLRCGKVFFIKKSVFNATLVFATSPLVLLGPGCNSFSIVPQKIGLSSVKS